jgi:hypothetical protein
MNRLSPKALPVFNLTEAILEETRMPKVIEFNQRRDWQDETPARGIFIGLVIGAECWAAAIEIYWLLRIYL